MDNCVAKAQSLLREVSLSPEIAFNTPAIFFLEFLILGMMYTQLAGDVTWRESLPSPIYFLILISRLAIRKAAKRGHCTRAEQEWCIMTE